MKQILVLVATAVLVQFGSFQGVFAQPQVPTEKDFERKENWKKCFSGDCKNGTGAFIYGQGSYYAGEWKDGKRHGRGKYHFSKGENNYDFYDGEYLNDYRHGKGTSRQRNVFWDEVYEGDWKAGIRDGEGSYTVNNYRDKKIFETFRYTGGFKAGEYSGKGELVEIKDNHTTKYTGDFLYGKKHGKGEQISNDGSKYTGEFSDDKFHGKGVLVKPDGSRIETVWENGEYTLKTAWVKAKGGLRMRNRPSTEGELVLLVPEREMVQVYEETGDIQAISGATGKWTRINYDDRTGWVFGGFLSGSPPGQRELYPLLNEFTGKWIRLEKEGNAFIILHSGSRTPSMEITYSNSHYPEAALIIIDTIQDSELWWIDNVIKSDSGAVFKARHYNYIMKEPGGKAVQIALAYLDGKKRVKITFKNGGYSEMIFIRSSYSKEVPWKPIGPEH